MSAFVVKRVRCGALAVPMWAVFKDNNMRPRRIYWRRYQARDDARLRNALAYAETKGKAPVGSWT